MDRTLHPSDPENDVPDWLCVSNRSFRGVSWVVNDDDDMCKPEDLRKEFDLPWTTVRACLEAAGVARAKKYDFAETEAAVTKFGPPLGAILRKRFVWLADISEEGLSTAVRFVAIKLVHEIGGDEYFAEDDVMRASIWWYEYKERRREQKRAERKKVSQARKEERRRKGA